MSTDQAASGVDERFAHLSGIERGVAESVIHPRWTVFVMVGVLAGLAWLWLALVAASISTNSGGVELGPTTGWLSQFADGLLLPLIEGLPAWLLALCTPQLSAAGTMSTALIAFLMWAVMSLAMMLPSAAPMLRTYADIADVAASRGQPTVSTTVFMSGYLAVWIGFALAATALQLALIALGAASDTVEPVQGYLSGAILIGAGLYQFSGFKEACLHKCRNPFSVLFGRWSDQTGRVFKLGAEQGVYCLGCCWALMSVMLVVGTMNLAWMMFFTLFAVIEKNSRGKAISVVSGNLLLAWGSAVIALSALT